MVPLPVALPHLRRRVTERGARDHLVLAAVADAAVVLTPRHLGGVGREVGAGDVVVDAHLGPTQTGEIALSLIGAGVVGAVGHLMVDAVGLERLVETVPALSLVSVNDGAGEHAGLNRVHALSLGTEGKGEGLTVALADHDDDAALAGLVLGKATVPPILLHVLRPDVAAEIGAIHFHRARHGGVRGLSGDGLAELVSHHKGGAVLAVEIAAQLERGVALGAVGEDGDGKQVVADRELAAGEDGPAGDAELVATSGALEELAGGDEGVLEATAAGAEGFAFGLGPSDGLERLPSLVIRHAGDLREAEGAGGAGEKEVLGHGAHLNVLR